MNNLEKIKESIKKFQQGGAFNYRTAAGIGNKYLESKGPMKKNHFLNDQFYNTYEENPNIAPSNIHVAQTNPGGTNPGTVVMDQGSRQSFAFQNDMLSSLFQKPIASPNRPAMPSSLLPKPAYKPASFMSMKFKGGVIQK